MSATLTPSPLMQFFTEGGVPLAGGKVYTYEAGTSTNAPTYTDATGTVANTNPVILNSRGEAAIWLTNYPTAPWTGSYKFVLTDSVNVQVWTADNLQGLLSAADIYNNTSASLGASLVGYLPAGFGAVGTNVQTKLRQTISVDDFGAVGNGSTNDQAAIVAAQTALVAAGGGTLLFTQSKTYLVASAIPMQAGVTYKGGGRSASDAGVPKGAKIVSSTSAIFNNTASTSLSGITFDGLTLQSMTGGSHIFDWDTVGLVSQVEIKNCFLQQTNPGSSVISGLGTVAGHGVFSIWMHHCSYSYAPSSTVSAINIRAFTVNTIMVDTFWSTCTSQIAAGFPSITIESTNAGAPAYNVLVRQGVFEYANGGAVKLLSCYMSGIEQCTSYDISLGLANPTFDISKGIGPGSALCWVKGCRSAVGSATYPDLRIDCATGGQHSVSESQLNYIDGVSANAPTISMRGNSITNFLNISFVSFNESLGRDIFFSGTNASSKSYALSNGTAIGSNGYLSFSYGAPVDATGVAPVLSYLGGFSSTGQFQIGGTAASPNMRITAGGALVLRRQAITYSASMAVDNDYQFFTITATNNTAFTITNPLYPTYDGQAITFTIRNTSGGALGVATWGTLYKLPAWTQPATGFSRSITFLCDGTNFIELSRTAADVPN